MPFGTIRTAAVAGFITAAGTTPGHAQSLIAAISGVYDGKFTVQAAGPQDKVLDFTACKGVWFAEQQKAQVISFGKPVYGQAKNFNAKGLALKVPDNWTMVTAIVYLSDHNPDGNRKVIVAEQAAICRQSWDWYQ